MLHRPPVTPRARHWLADPTPADRVANIRDGLADITLLLDELDNAVIRTNPVVVSTASRRDSTVPNPPDEGKRETAGAVDTTTRPAP